MRTEIWNALEEIAFKYQGSEEEFKSEIKRFLKLFFKEEDIDHEIMA